MNKHSAMGNTGEFQRGDSHPKFSGGRVVNEHGYVRVTVGRVHSKYEHRLVIEQLMLEQAIVERLDAHYSLSVTDLAVEVMDVVTNPPAIPPGVHIHHIDGDRQHNCPCNLMLLDAPLHRAVTAAQRRLQRRAEYDHMRQMLREAGL